jgi:sialate O-acetylesterase
MRHAIPIRLLLGLAVLTLASTRGLAEGDAEFRFARIINDNMVLQQEKPIVIWGWGPPGATIEVTITQDPAVGEAAISAAAKAGTRKAPPVVVESPDHRVTVRYDEQNPPVIKTQTVEGRADGSGRWEVAFDSARASFQPTWISARSKGSAIALENALVGEIWVCAGQSNMGWGNFNRKGREAASADFPGLRYIAWEDSWYKPLDDVRKNISWQECSPQTAQRFSAVPYLYGMFLHRYLKVPVGVVNVARGGTLGQTWCMREELNRIDHVTIKTVLKDYDAETARWDDPKEVERIMNEWQESVKTAEGEHAKKVAEAVAAGKREPRKRLPRKPGDPRAGWSPPAGLFNATVMPIRHMRIRGVLYYQGENNNFMRWTRYEHTFPRVPLSFRKAFGEKALPFGCISQPGWGTFGLDPEVATVAEGYAIVRDIQKRALRDDPHSGMIATYPTGNSYIHPGEKLPVAEYASLWALAQVYGKKVVHRGNEYQKLKIVDGRVFLSFDADPVVFDRWKHIENNAAWQVLPSPREGNAEILGFIIAGKDRRWYPAQARQQKFEGAWTIEVSSPLVPEPVAVRYGWANWPTGNLVGRERLPMATFRTDDWPIPEGVNYSDEAKKASEAKLKELKEIGAQQAADRKLRQALLDVPRLERERFKGDGAGLLTSKIARFEAILDELESKEAARALERVRPDLKEKLSDLRKGVAALKK